LLLYQQAGEIRKRSDPHGALEYFRRAVALDEELVAADPANASTRKDLGYQHKRIADFLANREDWSQALSHFSKAMEIFEKLGADAPADLMTRFRAATCRAGVAGMQAQLGELDSALEECRKTTALLQGITEDTTNVLHRKNRAETHQYLAYAYLALAASPKVSASESRQHRIAARDMFQQTLNILDASRKSAGDLGPDERWAKDIAAEIAKCDAALAK
jgi:tetratricopeptide (TPR) repeat protein